MVLAEAIALVKQKLAGIYSVGEVDTIAQQLTTFYFNISKVHYYTNRSARIEDENVQPFLQAVDRLEQHCPLQYVLGQAEFCGLTFHVAPEVLIPRPETEELVYWVHNHFKEYGSTIRLLDIGTGSGAIAVSLAHLLPKAEVTAVDISQAALAVASENAQQNNVDVQFLQADIFSPSAELRQCMFDVIVSNPPYVRELEKQQMKPNVLRYEPHLALFVPDSDPLKYYRAVADFAADNLSKSGIIYLEINEELGTETERLFTAGGRYTTELRCDMNGKPRMLAAKRLK